LVRPDIKTPADLKGKKVGVSRIGAVSHSVLLMMLKRWNMSPTDLQVLQLGSSPNMLAGLDKGGIDAAVMTIPFVFVAEDRGFRVLVDLAETDIYYLHTMIATTHKYILSNRDRVSRFVKGYLEGIAYFKQNRRESLEVVKKKLRLNARLCENSEISETVEKGHHVSSKFNDLIPKYDSVQAKSGTRMASS
jgi:NitT/TauT family transport system substrate-binding protein